MRVIGTVVQALLIVLGAVSMSACSQFVRLEIFNNTGRVVEVCDERSLGATCVTIPAGSSAQILSGADELSPWLLTMRAGGQTYRYEFAVAGKPEFAWAEICHGVNPRCDISLQLEPSLELHWLKRSRRKPADKFPEQPDGFPVAPIE